MRARAHVVMAVASLSLGTGPLVAQEADPLSPGAHRATLNGAGIAYHVAGDGPVVVAHSGGPGAEWTYLRSPELEAIARVVYIEPIGTGASDRLEDPKGYTMDRWVGDVEALRQHLGLERMILLGHSHGGFVAQAYALAHPEHLRGLILYDTTPTTGPEWQKDVESNLQWFAGEAWFPDAAQALSEETSATTDEQMTAIFRREMPLYFADWTAREAEFEPLRAAVRFSVAPSHSTDPSAPGEVGVAPPFDVVDRLGSIQVPTLVISGRKDFVCSLHFGQVIHEKIPGSRLVVMEKSGHMAHVEEPAAFGAAIEEFLSALAP